MLTGHLSDELGLVAGLALAALFTVSGLAKIADQPGTRTAVRDFGSPEGIVGAIALALPVVELTVVALLVASPTRVVGGAGAIALLGIFSAAIGLSLARGRTPDCHCFGQLHSAPTSWKTLVRNAVLAGFAVVVLAGGKNGTSAFGWLGNLSAAEVVAVSACLLTAVVAVGSSLAFVTLMRSHGRVLLRLDKVESALSEAGIEVAEEALLPELGLDPGTPAPAFAAESTTGSSVSLDDLLAPGLPVLLAFASPNCGPCKALMPKLAQWQVEHAESLTLAVAISGERDSVRAEAEENEFQWALLDADLALYDAYQATGTPSAVLISADGTIASYVASGANEIEQLVERALAGDEHYEQIEGLPIGAASPELDLRDLDGEPVSFADPDGRQTLVLFWNPDCGFCRSMLDDLLAWERNTPVGAPRLVVVSSGDGASSRADGFGSTVALDADFSAGTTFDAGGTPMAVLLDAEGRIASPLVAGAEAVLSLAGGRAATHPVAIGAAR